MRDLKDWAQECEVVDLRDLAIQRNWPGTALVWEQYRDWCRESGRQPLSRRRFVREVARCEGLKSRQVKRDGYSRLSCVPIRPRGWCEPPQAVTRYD